MRAHAEAVSGSPGTDRPCKETNEKGIKKRKGRGVKSEIRVEKKLKSEDRERGKGERRGEWRRGEKMRKKRGRT